MENNTGGEELQEELEYDGDDGNADERVGDTGGRTPWIL